MDNDYSRKHKVLIDACQANPMLNNLLSFVFTQSLEGEVWREVEGYNGEYFGSNCGRVLSLKWNGYKLLKPYTKDDSDYLFVDLYKDGEGNSIQVSRLIASLFIPNPEGKPIVHHKDTNPKNNNVNNLEWVDEEEHRERHAKLREAKK